jgi:hypothetical protein
MDLVIVIRISTLLLSDIIRLLIIPNVKLVSNRQSESTMRNSVLSLILDNLAALFSHPNPTFPNIKVVSVITWSQSSLSSTDLSQELKTYLLKPNLL